MGVRRDLTEAFKWFQAAAKQGQHEAQFTIGDMYLKGDGVPRDVIFGYAWISIAASHGVYDAIGARAALTQKLSNENLARAEELIAKLTKDIEREK